MYKKVLCILIFSIVIYPLSAMSETKEGSLEVSPFIGKYFYENKENFADKPVIGLRIGYNVTKNIAVEGVLEHINTHIENKSPEPTTYKPPLRDPDYSVMNTLYHVDALYNFMPENRFAPFVVAGIGGAHFKPSDTGSFDKFSANFGIGAKYWVTDSAVLRVDVRDIMTFDRTYHNIEATVGIVLAFGGKARPVAEPKPEQVAAPVPKPAPVPEAKPEPKPEPKPAEQPKAEPKPEARVIILEDVHFDFDKATLTKEAMMILSKNIQTLKENPDVRIRVEGHACAHGHEEYNLRLSERRANAVREYLMKEGAIAPERISTIAYGETRLSMPETPTPENKNSKEAKANRRVYFEVIVR